MIKSIFNYIMSLCIISFSLFTGCKVAINADDGNTSKRPLASNKIGMYVEPYEVGDVIFNDGSATPYSEIKNRNETSKLTNDEIKSAIAIIFYSGTGLNNDIGSEENNTTVRTLGIGLNQYRIGDWDININGSSTGYQWCRHNSDTDCANGYNVYLDGIVCNSSKQNGVRIFSGQKNGKDNLSLISNYLNGQSIEDDTYYDDLKNYPAFKFAYEYSTQATKNTDYDKNGWYLPSAAELYEIWNAYKNIELDDIICLFSGKGFNKVDSYCSSSQVTLNSQNIYIFALSFFDTENVESGAKKSGSYNICAIREF